jgi:hypothetical protein
MKDPRFEKFTKNQYKDPEYWEQKALFERYVQEFNNAGFTNVSSRQDEDLFFGFREGQVSKVTINGNGYSLDSETITQFYTGQVDNETGAYITVPVEVNANHITITFETDTDNSVELYDLMANKGEVKLAYSQNQNETTTDTVNISKGITITSSKEKVKFKANADGIRTLDERNEVRTEFTDKGMTTKEATIENEATIVGILRQRVDDQVWDSFIG